MANKLHVGDIGTALQVQVWNCDTNTAFDITGLTSKHIKLAKPDASTVNFAADLVHPGSGLIQYVTTSGDLDQVGIWRIQGIIDLNGGTFHTSIKDFTVYANL